MSASPPPLEYAAANTMLRAPRVAVVIDGSDNGWVDAARIALTQCTTVWGGAGFVLVPHRSGEVHPAVLEAVTKYDPDYVAISARTIAEREAADPGGIVIQGADGSPLAGAERMQLLERAGEQVVSEVAADAARHVVVAATSSHRMDLSADRGEVEIDDAYCHITSNGPAGMGLTPVAALREAANQRPCLSVPPSWGGAIGVLTAAKVGAAQWAQDEPSRQPTGPRAWKVAAWLQELSSTVPAEADDLALNPRGAALSFRVEDLPSAWWTSQIGLTSVSAGSTRLSPGFVVVGDSADDFALWLVLERLYGRAVWLHSDWMASETPEFDEIRTSAGRRLQATRHGVHVCSARSDADAVEVVRAGINAAAPKAPAGRRLRRLAVTSGPVPWRPVGMLTLAAEDQFGVEHPVPVHRGADGGFTLVAKPPTGSLSRLADDDDRFSWQVDLALEGTFMPRARGLLGHHLCAPDQDQHHTWIRSSRAAVTWHSARFDLVLEGEPAVRKIARPKVRELSVQEWTAAMAEQRGYEIQHSSAGISAHVLANLFGGRHQLIDSMGGPWRTVFRRFGPAGAPGNRGTTARYPEGEGAVLTGHGGILTFEGIRACWADESSADDVRQQVDSLVRRRVLRRGLALQCHECHKVAFVAVDSLGQVNRCGSCSALNDLDRAAWKKPADEPLWFYDLHPVARELVSQDGDLPLVVAHYIKSSVRSFSDVAETELLNGRRPVAETDLLIHADGSLITGEVKAGNELHAYRKERDRAAVKRAIWADAVRADEILLATTQDRWAESSIDAMVSALTRYRWTAPGHRPKLRLLTNIGGSAVQSDRVQW